MFGQDLPSAEAGVRSDRQRLSITDQVPSVFAVLMGEPAETDEVVVDARLCIRERRPEGVSARDSNLEAVGKRIDSQRTLAAGQTDGSQQEQAAQDTCVVA